MNSFFPIFLNCFVFGLGSLHSALDTAGVRLRLLEMTPEQAIELNLEMEAERVGRKETGEPVFQQVVGFAFERKLAEFTDVTFVNAPQLQVQLAKRGEIKIGKEIRYPKEQHPVNGRIQTGQQFLGYEILVVPFAGKGDIAVDVALKINFHELVKPGDLTEEGVVLPSFYETSLESRMIVTSGKTVCFGELTKMNGRKVMVIGTVIR